MKYFIIAVLVIWALVIFISMFRRGRCPKCGIIVACDECSNTKGW